MKNVDEKVVKDFGSEWGRFDQTNISKQELEEIFKKYFSLFPWSKLPSNAKGFDLGCGSGRWAMFCAPKVKELHCIEPAIEALEVAKRNLSTHSNCKFHNLIVDDMPFENASMDFGYSLGVLHHVPDTALGIKMCVDKLKPGAPFLLYLYYALDNKPIWFRGIWIVSDWIRRVISVMPNSLKYFFSQLIAIGIYFPLSRFSKLVDKLGFDVSNIPLSFYRDKNLYILRTDALDRFGTRLEQRFTKKQIGRMMLDAGLIDIKFRDEEPFWCALGFKK